MFARRVTLLTLLAIAATGCRPPPSPAQAIGWQFEQSGRRAVDLAAAVPQPWQRVCVLGPYTDAAAAQATLGFAWHDGALARIAADDGSTLLVFVGADRRVAAHASLPRSQGDFSNLGGRCFARAEARFTQVDRPARGWPGLFPAAATR